jgi:hypothetical protein
LIYLTCILPYRNFPRIINLQFVLIDGLKLCHMKIFCKAALILALLMFCANISQVQTTQAKLNQIELFKQFIGLWKGDIGKDTTEFWDVRSYGTGLECNYRYVTKDKIFKEGKQLWGYDYKNDKFIFAGMAKGSGLGISAIWFTSPNICVLVPYSYISNTEIPSNRLEVEFKSQDIFLRNGIANNNLAKTITYNKIKGDSSVLK